MRRLLQRVVRDGGQHQRLEYVIVAGLISVVAVMALIKVSQDISLVYADLDHVVQAIPSGW